MTKAVLFIHSAGPQGRHQGSYDFVTSLKKALGTDYKVKNPKMPNPEAPDYASWKVQVGKELARLENSSILIGHSLGGSVLMKYLSEENGDKSFAGLFLVATPYWGLPGWEYSAFYLKKGFARKLKRVGRIFIYHALDDETVSQDHAVRYAKSIPHATVRKVKGFGHEFSSGECPELTRDIKAL